MASITLVLYLDRCENLTNWTTVGTVAVDSSQHVEGFYAIKLTSANQAEASITKTGSWNFTGKSLRLWVKTDKVADAWYCLIRMRTSATFVDYFQFTPVWPGADYDFIDNGVVLDLNEKSFTKFNNADWSNIIGIKIELFSDAAKTVSIWVDDWQIVDNEASTGYISFRFDDCKADVYTTAKPILDAYGYKGSVAWSTLTAGTTGRLTLTQLKELYNLGWDIIPHGYNLNATSNDEHIFWSTMNENEIEAEIRSSKKACEDQGFWRSSRFFVPPQHIIASWNIFSVIKKWFQTCQWKTSTFFTSVPPPDPYWIQSALVTQVAMDTLVEQKAAVDEAIRTKTWLTFYCHDVTDYADFAALVTYVNSSGAKVVVPSDLFPLQKLDQSPFLQLKKQCEGLGLSTETNLYSLRLGNADSTTGWYASIYAVMPIEMIIVPRTSTRLVTNIGVHPRHDVSGYTKDVVDEGSRIENPNTHEWYTVEQCDPTRIGDKTIYWESALTKTISSDQRPSTSGTWPTIDDASHRQKVFIDTYITPGNLKKDDNATNATTLTCLGMPDYPASLVFGGTKNVDLIFSIAEARSTALVDHDYKAYAYENDVDIDICAIDKATVTARRLIYAGERELQLILEGYPTGSLRSYGKGEPHPQDLGSCRLWTKRVTIHYVRKKTE